MRSSFVLVAEGVIRDAKTWSCPGSVEEARRRITSFIEHYNTVRLHSALGHLTPADKFAGLDAMIFAERERKVE